MILYIIFRELQKGRSQSTQRSTYVHIGILIECASILISEAVTKIFEFSSSITRPPISQHTFGIMQASCGGKYFCLLGQNLGAIFVIFGMKYNDLSALT